VDQILEVQGGERHVAPKAPGFTLMLHMLNDTPMLRMVNTFYCDNELKIVILYSRFVHVHVWHGWHCGNAPASHHCSLSAMAHDSTTVLIM
jgi:hypothetical protein